MYISKKLGLFKQYKESLEDLLCFSLKDVKKELRMRGYTLEQIISGLESGRVKACSGTTSWASTLGSSGDKKEIGKIGYSLEKRESGICLVMRYKCKLPTETETKFIELKYNLKRKESNLLSKTYRYYIEYPYLCNSVIFCTKLYLYPTDGIFYPGIIMREKGILYRQQKEGHTQRYVWTFINRVPSLWRKYGKTHYRGRITPGYKRYGYLCREVELREMAFILKRDPACRFYLEERKGKEVRNFVKELE